jgi:hypothetical protein
MTITIELPPETGAALKSDAEAQGRDPEQLVRGLVEQAYTSPEGEAPAGRPGLAELYAGEFGRIEGNGSASARDAGRLFGEYVAQKKREGRL